MLRILPLACLGCGASVSHTTSATPPSPLPSVVSAPVFSFVPDTGFTMLQLPCVGTEAPAPNGLDDDCDTRIDGEQGAPSSALSVALAWAAGTEITLLLTRTGEPLKTRSSSTTGVCEDDAGFSLLRANFDALEPDAYEVLLLRGDGCGARDATPPVVVSLWQQERALGTFTGTLSAGERVRLGVLTVR